MPTIRSEGGRPRGWCRIETLLEMVRSARTACGRPRRSNRYTNNRHTTRLQGALLQKQALGPVALSGHRHRRGQTGQAATNDNDIGFFIPLNLVHRCRFIISRRLGCRGASSQPRNSRTTQGHRRRLQKRASRLHDVHDFPPEQFGASHRPPVRRQDDHGR